MITKSIFPISLALICLLLFSGVALAGDEDPQNVAQAVYGEIIVLGVDSLTVENPSGEQIVFLVDDNTRYRSRNMDQPNFEDLHEDTKVAIYSRPSNENKSLARMIILLPEDFKPGQWASIRTRGEITNVDTTAMSFSVQSQDGEELSFSVDDETRFFGQVAGIGDLQIGWQVAVGGTENDDGRYLAKLVGSVDLKNTRTRTGMINEVNLSADSFTLITRQDDEFTVTVDENTRYRSRDGQIQDLENLEQGMVAIAVGVSQEDGSFLAARVAAGNEDDLPNFDVKIGGTISAIGEDSITVQNRAGEETTFTVDAETRFQGRGSVSSLDDFEVGIVALVGGFENGDGNPAAKLVIVGKSQD